MARRRKWSEKQWRIHTEHVREIGRRVMARVGVAENPQGAPQDKPGVAYGWGPGDQVTVHVTTILSDGPDLEARLERLLRGMVDALATGSVEHYPPETFRVNPRLH